MPERAQQIMDVAMELADEGGFEAVRLRDVAAKAGVALGTLYARFSSKEDILIGVLEQEAVKLEGLFEMYPAELPTAEERVIYYFTVMTQAMFGRPNFARAVLRAVATGSPENAAKIARYQDRLTQLFVTALRGDGADETGVPVEREEEIAFLLQQIWFSALVGWMSGIRKDDEVMEQMRMSTSLILAGVAAGG